VLTARTEITDRMLIFGQRHLRTALAEFVRHYNGRRPHRGRQLHPPRAQRPPDLHADPPSFTDFADRRIRRKPILAGLINEYEHAA
jgi:hypothetical protein